MSFEDVPRLGPVSALMTSQPTMAPRPGQILPRSALMNSPSMPISPHSPASASAAPNADGLLLVPFVHICKGGIASC
jgi:hypothetical protein